MLVSARWWLEFVSPQGLNHVFDALSMTTEFIPVQCDSACLRFKPIKPQVNGSCLMCQGSATDAVDASSGDGR